MRDSLIVEKSTGTVRRQFDVALDSDENERRRLALLQKIRTDPSQKINTLAKGLTDAESRELIQLTRETYGQMESARSALARLDAVLLKHFSLLDAKELQTLARHTMGLHLNTHQYHNAVHALSMTRESLHLAEIAEITDPKILQTLVIQGLYHDTGNGREPKPATSKDADETQAVEIFMRDVKEAERRVREGEPVSELNALARLTSVKVGGEDQDQKTVIAACIAATVFRDRFAPTESLALQEYVGGVLEHVHGAEDYNSLPIRHLTDMTKLMGSVPAWIARDADVVGSTYTPSVLYNNILNRVEDTRRGLAKGTGPKKYDAGFVGFISAAYHQGKPTEAVTVAKEGSPLYLPAGEGNAVAIKEYGKKQLTEEERRFEILLHEHEPMLNALFVLIGEAHANHEEILHMPLKEIRVRLVKLAEDPARATRTQGILTDEKIDSFDLDLSAYPLLQNQRYEQMTLAGMTPGTMNRIFAPNAQQTKDQEWISDRLEDIEQQSSPDKQPVLLSALELANIHPEDLERRHFAAGSSIIEKEHKPGFVYIILQGAAQIRLDGREFAMGEGSVLGEISALYDTGATADVIAVSDVEVVSLPAKLVADEYRTEEMRQRMTDLAEKRLGRSP